MFSFALGIGAKDSAGNWLEVFFPRPFFQPSQEEVAALSETLGYQGGNQVLEVSGQQLTGLAAHPEAFAADEANLQLPWPRASAARSESFSPDGSAEEVQGLPGAAGPAAKEGTQATRRAAPPIVAVFLERDERPQSVPEAYLKLHLLSHRLVKPHQVNLDGLFGLLPNVAWTNQGAIAVSELARQQLQARLRGETLEVASIDKFPKMTNYVAPPGVRIADTARVRLGAYIGAGTTIMHEGFVNFNAGSEGEAMIEGRISAGVLVGSGSDLGGGCSIMGTLSGGGTEIVSVGKDCLIGANAGLGFSLGDRCVIEAGLYVTAGAKVAVIGADGKAEKTVKARDLSHQDDLLFIRNSMTGAVECRPRKSGISLNPELHSHN